MNTNNKPLAGQVPLHILRSSFFVMIALSLLGAWLRYSHSYWADYGLLLALFAGLVFGLLALKDMFNTASRSTSEKIMWIVGLIFLSLITGFIYLRRKEAASYRSRR